MKYWKLAVYIILKSKIFFCKISPGKYRKLHLRYHRLGILTRCLTKQNLCPRFLRCSRQPSSDCRVSLRQICRVTRAGKCRSRQICSRHRSGVTINAHAQASGKCNALFLLGKRFGNAKFWQLNGDFRRNYRLIFIFWTNFTDE